MKTLCQSVVDVAKERCPVLTPKATFLDNTFEKAFRYFADCRHIYDSAKILEEREISDLGMHIIITELLTTIILVIHRGTN